MPLARQAAYLCRLTDADETLIPQWIIEGRRRAGSPQAAAQRTAQAATMTEEAIVERDNCGIVNA